MSSIRSVRVLGKLGGVLMLGVCLLHAGFLHAQDKAMQIKSLREEQKRVLDNALKELTALWKMGGGLSNEETIRAIDRVLRSKLAIAESGKERIAVLRQLVENGNRAFENQKTLFAAGVSKRYELLLAEARWLEVRVELLQEEQKQERK